MIKTQDVVLSKDTPGFLSLMDNQQIRIRVRLCTDTGRLFFCQSLIRTADHCTCSISVRFLVLSSRLLELICWFYDSCLQAKIMYKLTDPDQRFCLHQFIHCCGVKYQTNNGWVKSTGFLSREAQEVSSAAIFTGIREPQPCPEEWFNFSHHLNRNRFRGQGPVKVGPGESIFQYINGLKAFFQHTPAFHPTLLVEWLKNIKADFIINAKDAYTDANLPGLCMIRYSQEICLSHELQVILSTMALWMCDNSRSYPCMYQKTVHAGFLDFIKLRKLRKTSKEKTIR